MELVVEKNSWSWKLLIKTTENAFVAQINSTWMRSKASQEAVISSSLFWHWHCNSRSASTDAYLALAKYEGAPRIEQMRITPLTVVASRCTERCTLLTDLWHERRAKRQLLCLSLSLSRSPVYFQCDRTACVSWPLQFIPSIHRNDLHTEGGGRRYVFAAARTLLSNARSKKTTSATKRSIFLLIGFGNARNCEAPRWHTHPTNSLPPSSSCTGDDYCVASTKANGGCATLPSQFSRNSFNQLEN